MNSNQPSRSQSLSKLSRYLLCAPLCLAANTAVAAEFCATLTTLTGQARANFVEGSALMTGLLVLPGAEKCSLGRGMSGINAYNCAWRFSYRDEAATTTFEGFNTLIRDCLKGSTEMVQDSGVNHPDSYVQRVHVSDQVTVNISIKDKGALQETYVFVAVQSVDPD